MSSNTFAQAAQIHAVQFALKFNDPMVRRVGEIADQAIKRNHKIQNELKEQTRELNEMKKVVRTKNSELKKALKAKETDTRKINRLEVRIQSLETMLTSSGRVAEEVRTANSQNKTLLEENDALKKTIEKLNAIIEQKNISESQKDNVIKELKARLEMETQEKEVTADELNRQTRQNSTNSNYPTPFDTGRRTPSKSKESQNQTDTQSQTAAEIMAEEANKKRLPSSSRTRSGNPRGGQKGHPVHRKELSDNPDHVLYRFVKKVPAGAVKCTDENGRVYYAVQTITMKTIAETTETRYYPDPDGETPSQEEMTTFSVSSVAYSTAVKSLCLFLLIFSRMPYNRVVSTIASITHDQIKLSGGTIAKWVQSISKKAQSVNRAVLKRMMKEKVLYCDETGIRISGKMYWLHVLASDKEVVYIVTRTRGGSEKGPVALIKEMGFKGTLVHDHYASYLTLTDVLHQECNVHIERYMRNGIDFDHSLACSDMLDLFKKLRQKKAEMQSKGETGFSEEEYEETFSEFNRICKAGMKEWEDRADKCGGMEKMKKFTPPYYNTLKRMKESPDDYLRFILDFDVPFGNNRAEQCVATAKTKFRVSRQCVTEDGAEALAELLTFTESGRSRDANILDELMNLISGDSHTTAVLPAESGV